MGNRFTIGKNNTPARWWVDGQVGFWTPSVVFPTAWWDASDAGSVIESGGSVSQWNDRSGNGNNLTQGTGGNQPQTGSSINGLNALTFDGVNSRLESTLQQLTTLTMYYVVEPVSKGSNQNSTVIGANSEFQSGGCNAQAQVFANGSPRFRVWYNSVVPNAQRSYNGTVGVEPTVFEPGICGHWGSGFNTESLNYFVGNKVNPPTSTNAYKGDLGEIIIIPSVLDSLTLQKLEGYLAYKWNLTDKLPSDHPYKNTRPRL